MTITLRRTTDGAPVSVGDVLTLPRGGGAWKIVNWSHGALKVYARRLDAANHTEPQELAPRFLGLYIGHESGQPVGSIKWGSRAVAKPIPEARKVNHLDLNGFEVTLLHMALRYLRDHGTDKGSPTAREIAALLSRLDKLKEV